MQHKKELGNKYVTGIRILRNDDQASDADRGADLVFYIENVPAGGAIQDVPDQDPPQGQPPPASLATSQPKNLGLRDLPRHWVEERVLGPKNLLRVYTINAS